MCKLPFSREGPASERSHHLSASQLSSHPDGSPQVFLEGHSEAAISSSDFISGLLANIVVWDFFFLVSFFFFFPPCCFRWWQVLMSTSNYPIFLSPAPAPGPLLTHRVTLVVILSRGTKTVWAWMNKFLPSLLEVVPRDHFFRQRDFPLCRTNSAIHRKNMLMEASFMPESVCVCLRLSSNDSAAPATGCSS